MKRKEGVFISHVKIGIILRLLSIIDVKVRMLSGLRRPKFYDSLMGTRILGMVLRK